MPSVRIIVAVALWMAGVVPVAAQAPQTVPQAEPCVEGRTRSGEPCTLSNQLDETNGIIRPPAGVDPEMHVPPPDTGTTPVIPPEAVPPQPSDGMGEATPK